MQTWEELKYEVWQGPKKRYESDRNFYFSEGHETVERIIPDSLLFQ